MIGTINVKCNAAHPEMALPGVFAFAGSPSSVRVVDVPKKIGKWSISKVHLTAVYPDSTSQTVECVLTGGCWVGTLAGSGNAGASQNGFTITADGVDENGNAVTGYVLGKGDITVLEAGVQPNPDQTSWYVRVMGSESGNHNTGDLWPADGTYYVWQNGQANAIGPTRAEMSAKADLSAVQSALDAKADLSALNEVENEVTDLGNRFQGYYAKTETSSSVELDSEFADVRGAIAGVDNSLSGYYAKTETSSATEIQTALDGKQPTGNYALVSQIPLSVSQLENDSGYLTEHQSLSDYYTKNETSSNAEISTALNLKQDTLTSEQLSNIARVPYIDPANTIVTFDDDSVGVYNVVGELTQNIKQEWERLAGAYVKDIKIGTNVNALGNSLFYRAYNNILTKVTIPNSVTSIGSGAFSGCTSLTKVTIPNSVTNIANSAFIGCSNLTSVTIPNGVTSIEGFAFRSCTSLSSVTIPESTTNIGENAFRQSWITNITIPNSISNIGNDAFFGCSNLTSLTFKGKTLAEVQAMSNYPWGISDTSIIKTWNDASQEWVLEQLSALEARITALENS